MFPTAFTPNEDGLNDRFGPLGSIAAVKQYRLLVYNRWGQLVFKSTNAPERWDGRVAGKLGDSAMFTWYCEYQLPGQNKSTKKGTLILIR